MVKSDKNNSKGIKDKTKNIQSTQRHVELLGVIIILIVLIGGYIILIKPEFVFRKELKVKLLTTKNNLEIKNNKLAKLNRVTKSYDEVNSVNRKFIDELIPDDFDFSSILINFSAIAAKNNMQIQSVNYSFSSLPKKKIDKDKQTAFSDNLVWVDLSLKINGSGYNNFKNLIGDIENNSRLTEIITFGFDPLTTQFDLMLRVYYYNSSNVSKTTQ